MRHKLTFISIDEIVTSGLSRTRAGEAEIRGSTCLTSELLWALTPAVSQRKSYERCTGRLKSKTTQWKFRKVNYIVFFCLFAIVK